MKATLFAALLAAALGASAGAHAQSMNGGADGGGSTTAAQGIDPGGSRASAGKPGKSARHKSSKSHAGARDKTQTLGGGPLGAGAGMSGSDSSTGTTPSAARAPTTR